MAKTALAKQAFGTPSQEVLATVDNSDRVQALRAAGFRFEAALRELERMFETRAGELRAAYIAEVEGINGAEE